MVTIAAGHSRLKAGTFCCHRAASPMILQLGVFLLSLLLFATWGLPVAVALRGAMPMMVLSAPAFGAGLLAVVATVLFSFGLPLSVIAIGAVAVSLISIIVFRKALQFMLSVIQEAWIASCLVLVFSIIILAPILANRAALTVFQSEYLGSIWLYGHVGGLLPDGFPSDTWSNSARLPVKSITFLCPSKSRRPSVRLYPVCCDRQSVARRYDRRWIRLPLQFRGCRPPFLLCISFAGLPSLRDDRLELWLSFWPVRMHAAFGANIR